MKAKTAEHSVMWIGGGILALYLLSKLNLTDKIGAGLGNIIGGAVSGAGGAAGNLLGGAVSGIGGGVANIGIGVIDAVGTPEVTSQINEGKNAFREHGYLGTFGMITKDLFTGATGAHIVDQTIQKANQQSLDDGVTHVAANGGIGGAAYAYYYPYYMGKHWIDSLEFNALVRKAQGLPYSDAYIVTGDAKLASHKLGEYAQ